MLVLQAIGGNRRIKQGNINDKPLIVVLAGSNQLGTYAIAGARHLMNHEYINTNLFILLIDVV